MIDGSRRQEKSLGNRDVGQALAQQRQDLSLTTRESVRIMLRRGVRAARDPADAAGPHLAAQRICGGHGSELHEDSECLTLLGLPTVPAQHDRLLVGTAKRLPCLRCGAPVALDFHRVRLSDTPRGVGKGRLLTPKLPHTTGYFGMT